MRWHSIVAVSCDASHLFPLVAIGDGDKVSVSSWWTPWTRWVPVSREKTEIFHVYISYMCKETVGEHNWRRCYFRCAVILDIPEEYLPIFPSVREEWRIINVKIFFFSQFMELWNLIFLYLHFILHTQRMYLTYRDRKINDKSKLAFFCNEERSSDVFLEILIASPPLPR